MGVAELARNEAFILAKCEFRDRRMHHRDVDIAGQRLEGLGLRPRRIELNRPLVLEVKRVDGDETKRLRRLLQDRRDQIPGLFLDPAIDAIDYLRVAKAVDQHVGAGARQAEQRKLLRANRAIEGQQIGQRQRTVACALCDDRRHAAPKRPQIVVGLLPPCNVLET
jgi:hypothetical protein